MRLPHTEVWKCLNPSCALMFAFPQLDDLALGAAYQNFYYPAPDTGIAAYENTPEQILRQAFDKAEAELGPLAGKSLLDFGCGVGALCKVASEYGIRAVGIEPDANAREKACESIGLRTYASLRDLREAHPYSKFDIVTMWDVIEHLREPWKELEDLSDALQPEGWLMLSTPNAASLRARVERERWENIVNPTHFYYFTRKSLEAALKRAGFSDVRELQISIRYPEHRIVRRIVHHALVSCRLGGQLVFLARQRMLQTASSVCSFEGQRGNEIHAAE
jgi:cyclopropane fatty-acyl-phospholipid synthase-like methyltransferase